MAVKNRAFQKQFIKNRGDLGCEACGRMIPPLDNKGLHACHIYSGGPDAEDNLLALCPSCSEMFDRFLKRKIHHALFKYCDGRVPSNWEYSEGRKSKKDK